MGSDGFNIGGAYEAPPMSPTKSLLDGDDMSSDAAPGALSGRSSPAGKREGGGGGGGGHWPISGGRGASLSMERMATIGAARDARHPSSHSHSDTYHTNENFKVVIRVRPPLERELAGGKQYQHSVSVGEDKQLCTISENLSAWKGGNGPVGSDGVVYNTHQFKFDHVYDQDASQETVYERSAKDAVLSTLLGYNAAMLAYGGAGRRTETKKRTEAGEKTRCALDTPAVDPPSRRRFEKL